MSNLIYQSDFLETREKSELLRFLESLTPIWEMRYSSSNPPPSGEPNRPLLRPVYWLGNWQFACLNYYHPPKGIEFRCVQAEPYPEVMARMVARLEDRVRSEFRPGDVPKGWTLNTCLVNYYGSRLEGDRWVDTARVGEHRDFEPGPVASVSFGERALFQFVQTFSKAGPSRVVKQMWLDDNSLQVFGGEQWKKKYFHRVQRVDRRAGHQFLTDFPGFKTRRINLTFRYVPRDHIQPLSRFPQKLKQDLAPMVQELGKNSNYFRALCADLGL